MKSEGRRLLVPGRLQLGGRGRMLGSDRFTATLEVVSQGLERYLAGSGGAESERTPRAVGLPYAQSSIEEPELKVAVPGRDELEVPLGAGHDLTTVWSFVA